MKISVRFLMVGLLVAIGCGDDDAPVDGGPDANVMDSSIDAFDAGNDAGGPDVPDPCADIVQCDVAGTACDGDMLTTCAPDANGCRVPTSMACDNGCGLAGGTAACLDDPCAGVPEADRCDTDGERLCDGDTLGICGDNGSGCLVVEETECDASPGGVCTDTGAMPMCVLPPDPCEGLADACAVEGASCDADSLVTCAPNAFGCLVETSADCTERADGTCSTDTNACVFVGDACDAVEQCADLGVSCDGPNLVTCAIDAFGCQVETQTACDDTMFGFCDADGAPNSCSTAAVDGCMGVTDCDPAGTTCDGANLSVCEANAFGCFIEEVTDCGARDETCSDAGDVTMCVDLCAEVDCFGAGDQCTTTTCNPTNGLCDVVTNLMDGTSCEDGRSCTAMDTCSAGACSAGANTCEFEYFEDFEADDGAFTAGGTGTISWEYGVPAGGLDDPDTGSLWATNLTGDYNSSENSYIESPVIDMTTATTDPVLTFQLYREFESCCDEGFAEISFDGGMTYNRLGVSGDGNNWYNDSGNDWWDNTVGWSPTQIPLVGAAGQSMVRFRFHISTDGSVARDGLGIDNIVVRTGLEVDASLVSATPLATCGPGSIELVVRNDGSMPIASVDVEVEVSGVVVSETFALAPTLAPGESQTLTTTGTFAPGGTSVRIVVADDGDTAGNSLSFAGTPTVAFGSGYQRDFDHSNAFWTGTGSWARGAPSNTIIDSADSGTSAWVTNLDGDYANNEMSFLTSPCIDMTALAADPTLSFAHRYETESCCDEGFIEIWTASTNTWTRLGASGEGTGWYNDSANVWWDGTSPDGGWGVVSHVLDGATGEFVRIRHVLSTDGSVAREGFGFDSVSIDPAP